MTKRSALGDNEADDYLLGPESELSDRPTVADDFDIGKDANVVSMRATRPLGDPMADFIDLWMTLEAFHERRALTEDGWACLTEELQRPLELRLAERRPATGAGALKALEMARYLMDNLDSPDAGETGDWYRRLRNHLVESAHDALRSGLLSQPEKRRPGQRSGELGKTEQRAAATTNERDNHAAR